MARTNGFDPDTMLRHASGPSCSPYEKPLEGISIVLHFAEGHALDLERGLLPLAAKASAEASRPKAAEATRCSVDRSGIYLWLHCRSKEA